MDNERKLLLLQLKSDLKEVLKLTREKSDEIAQSFNTKQDCEVEKFDDLEYYLTSLLDITQEMKNMMVRDEFPALKPIFVKSQSKEFEHLLKQLSQANDTESLLEILDLLEQGEHYELCAIVNEKIKQAKAS